MTALTKIYDANLDITDANIQDVSGDVTKTTYIRIPVTLPTSGQISLSIGGYNSEVEQPGPYISSATLRALDVLVAGYNRDRSKSVPFTFLNMLFGGNTQVNDVIVWAGRNAANELLLVFEIDNETPTGSGSAASYQDVRNIDPNPLVVNHLTFSPEDSFNLPTTDDSAAIVDTDLMVMLPADVSGQTRVNPVMQSWADLKADVGAAGGAQVAANTAAIATNTAAIARVMGVPTIPTGGVLMWMGTTVPAGWLLCDGAAVSRTTYAVLYAVLGDRAGPGDGSTTFNVPDLRGRFPLGMDDMGSARGAANRVVNPQADVAGGSGGEETHTLMVAEMPAHSHEMDVDRASGGSQSVAGGRGTGTRTNATGGGQAHNNMPPWLALSYIIKA